MSHNNSTGTVSLFVPLFLFLLLLISCQSETSSSFEDLSEEERHSPEHALAGIELREGLEATLFSFEEQVINPTNFDIDDRGRIWVTEGVNYRPDLNPDMPVKEEGDRIVILEDTDGDGVADSEKVFYQGREIDSALGIMVLGNRVFVSRSPHVYVFTDTTGNDRADTMEILFSGIGGEQHDHGVHAFVFGPDGKLYFNAGDAGTQVHDADGEIIVDMAGNEVRTDGNPYRKGMVFRTTLDGGEFEVLGHNFRNNYEVAVDSYGTIWQSDNDDDGNRSVRINYVMEYGNYGYTDEITGAGWRSQRINMEEEIYDRHWYQNDPGVVPNLLDTGAGSPTGILVYEGTLLPEIFHNQMIHADAGPNVVRSYPVEPEGAGYRATIEELMKGVENQWFRPSDVAVAPDGSIFVADWYDPGVGGHQVRASEQGRIYRISPKDTPYRVPDVDYSTPESAILALKSPNHATRSKAWLQFQKWGEDAETVLSELWRSGEADHLRARALWLLSKLDESGPGYLEEAFSEENTDLRITALRAARQLDLDLVPILQELADDPSPQVRREVAIALRHHESPEAARLWAQLANQYDGEDRWYLEALGIGADRQWDRYLEAWLALNDGNWNSPAGLDIVWRARAEAAVPILASIISDDSIPAAEKPRYFRALEFHDPEVTESAILGLLETDLQEQIHFYTLQLLERDHLDGNMEAVRVLNEVLEHYSGTEEFLRLVTHFGLEDRDEELTEMILAAPESDLGVNAARYMLQNNGVAHLEELIRNTEGEVSERVLTAISGVSSNSSLTLLQSIVMDNSYPFETRRQAIEAFGAGNWSAENRLLGMARDGEIPPELEASAANVLMGSFRSGIREEAAQYLQIAQAPGEEVAVRPVSELVELRGDEARGRIVYEQLCQMCHVAAGSGIQFGPELTEIGDKLPREGLYNSILEPNDGINFGYEGYILTLSDETRVTGIIDSETDSELILRLPGGATQTYAVSDIESREQLEQSLMPALQGSMTEAQLVDLVEYLTTLTQ